MNVFYAALPLFLTAVLPAQDRGAIAVEYADGRTAHVEVLSLDGERTKLKVLILGGSMVVHRRLAEFTPQSAFRIEVRARPPKTYEDHFRFAKMADDRGLLAASGAHARTAVELAGKDTQRVDAVRGWAAHALEARLRQALAAEDLGAAVHYLELLSTRFADRRTVPQLAKFVSAVAELRTRRRDAERTARQTRLDAKTKESIRRRMKPLRARIARGEKLQFEALMNSRHTVASTRLAERAVAAYQSAWRSARDLASDYPDDASLQAEVERLGHRMQTSVIASSLHAANMLTVQSDYKGALGWAYRILRLDPGNTEAKEMIRTIQIAQAAASHRWGWRWRRGRQRARPARRRF